MGKIYTTIVFLLAVGAGIAYVPFSRGSSFRDIATKVLNIAGIGTPTKDSQVKDKTAAERAIMAGLFAGEEGEKQPVVEKKEDPFQDQTSLSEPFSSELSNSGSNVEVNTPSEIAEKTTSANNSNQLELILAKNSELENLVSENSASLASALTENAQLLQQIEDLGAKLTSRKNFGAGINLDDPLAEAKILKQSETELLAQVVQHRKKTKNYSEELRAKNRMIADLERKNREMDNRLALLRSELDQSPSSSNNVFSAEKSKLVAENKKLREQLSSLSAGDKDGGNSDQLVKKLKKDLITLKSQLRLKDEEISTIGMGEVPRSRKLSSTIEVPETKVLKQPPSAKDSARKDFNARDMTMTVRVIVPKANLRTGPGAEHGVIKQVPKNVDLLVEAKQGDWFRVISPTGKRAFVSAAVVKTVGNTSSAVNREKNVQQAKKPIRKMKSTAAPQIPEGFVPFGGAATSSSSSGAELSAFERLKKKFNK